MRILGGKRTGSTQSSKNFQVLACSARAGTRDKMILTCGFHDAAIAMDSICIMRSLARQNSKPNLLSRCDRKLPAHLYPDMGIGETIEELILVSEASFFPNLVRDTILLKHNCY